MCSPFLKWAGGKRQLIPIIEKIYPFDDNYTRYVEPFIGGGAVLFDILSNHNVKEIYISDINEKLVNTYIIIQKHCNLLINELTRLANEYTSQSVENKKKYFLARRDNFNDVRDVLSKSKKVRIEQAALMIFLNKTCFNGLYRVNSEGKFNVSFGEYKNPIICDADNLRSVSNKLKDVNIFCCSYQNMKKYIDEHTFVFLDPPYRPLNKTANFNSYSNTGFNDNDQIKLAEFAEYIDNVGGKFIVCNSDPHNVDVNDDFFDNLYANFTIHRVAATRMINSKASKRGTINELLITNI
jgi:DNA adenine methylase